MLVLLYILHVHEIVIYAYMISHSVPLSNSFLMIPHDFLMIVLGSSRVCHENSYKSMISPCFHHFPYVFPRVSLWFPQKFHLRFLPWFRGFHRWGGDFLDESSCVNPCPDGKFPEGKVRFSARWSRNGNHMGTLFWWERLPMWCFFFSLLFYHFVVSIWIYGRNQFVKLEL